MIGVGKDERSSSDRDLSTVTIKRMDQWFRAG